MLSWSFFLNFFKFFLLFINVQLKHSIANFHSGLESWEHHHHSIRKKEKKVGDKNGGSCSLFGLGPKRRKTRENNLTDPLWIHFDSLQLISLCQSIKTQQAIYSPNVFD